MMGALIRGLWGRFHEPRASTAWQLVAYTTTTLIGAVLMVGRPGGAVDALGWGLTVTAGFILTISSASAAAFCLAGEWAFERVGILVVVTTQVALLPALWDYDASTVTMRLLLTLQTGGVLALLGARYAGIRWAYLDPAR